MTTYVTGSSGAFPQTSQGRTRTQASSELAQYVGGEARGDALTRCGQVWDASVRAFNSIAWKFNRVTQDILLDSTMPDATTAPTVSRDAGTGTGFVLTSGTKIDYWVQERVKVATTITKRNFSASGKIIQLTGDGTTDKPVITRATTVGADTTHWALYGTAAGSAYPDGAELGEVAIATTTIEDTRTGNDPPLPGSPVLYEPYDWDLNSDFRNPRRAWWIDAKGLERGRIGYLAWEGDYGIFDFQGGGSSLPYAYTVRNAFATGKVMFYPRTRIPQSYPIARLLYNKRIAFASADTSVLAVPPEVDEAIFQYAAALILSRVRTFEEAKSAFILALSMRQEVEQEHKDFPDRERA